MATILPQILCSSLALSFKELCSNYTNHPDGELLEMSDVGLKPRDMAEMMTADMRHPGLGREWSWVAGRTKKARRAREGLHGAVSQQNLRNQAGLQVKVHS
jgi:hypothetical protein